MPAELAKNDFVPKFSFGKGFTAPNLGNRCRKDMIPDHSDAVIGSSTISLQSETRIANTRSPPRANAESAQQHLAGGA